MKKLLALLMAVAVTFQLVTPVFADTEGTEEATAPTEAVVETKAPTEAPAEETTAPTEETTAPTEETSAPTEATEETEEATEETVEDIDLFADNGDMIASGECGKNGNNLTWVLTGDGTLTISGSGEMENYTDSSVAPWYSNRTKILSAVVEPGVESVGNYAFYACLKLASVSLPGGVKSIGESAFQDCAKLTAVEIPEGVTSIDYQTFYGCSSLTSVTIPDSVTSIGGDAFNGCSNLTSVMIPGSVTSIGGDAFRDCDGLTSVTIPEGVTSIGGGAFEDCSNLINVTIPKGVTKIGIYAFYACSSLTSVTIPEGVTDIGDATFMYCSNLTDVTIPGSVTSIGEFAFEGCNSLINMTIPESVTSISGYAFSGCGSLTSVTIPGRVTGIGGYAFFGCSNLTDVTILEGVIGIGGYAFGGCRSLTSVTIPRSVTSISEGAFDVCNQLKDVYYGGSDTQWKRVRIGDSNNCLTGATIHYNPVHVHDLLLISNRAASCMKAGCNAYYICYDCKKAFKDADGKTETTAGAEALPALGHDMAKTEAVEPTYWNVGNNAYYTCSRCGKVFKDANGETETTVEDEALVMLPSIAYGTCGDEGDNLIWVLTEDGTLTISGSGEMKNYSDSSVAPWYSNRTKILSAVVESGVTSIGDYAFYACLKLNSVTLHGDVKSIGGYVFQDCTKLTAVEIPEGVTSIGYRAFAGCSGLTSVTIPESVTSIGSGAFYDCSSLITGVTIPKGVTSIASAIFHGCSRLTSVTIPEGVTSIGGSAFYGCSNLTSVTIPEGVVSLGYFAFHGCSSLTSVTIPEGVPSIGDHVFYGCSKLTSVVIPEGVTSIGSSAFAGCSSLTSVTIPEDVTSIGSSAFSSCSGLTSVTIPESVTSIDSAAFSGCDKLKHVYYGGSDLQWKEIEIGNYNYNLTDAIIHYASTHAHNVEHVPEKAASCTETGNLEYWLCSICGKYFTDETFTKSTDEAGVTLPALGHALTLKKAVKPTHKTAGNIEYYICSRCEKLFKDALGTEETTLEEVTLPMISYVTEIILTRDGELVPETMEVDGRTSRTLSFAVMVQPAGAETKVEWSSSVPAVARMNQSGIVTLLTSGTTVITAAATDGSEVTAQVTLNVTAPDYAPRLGASTLTLNSVSCAGVSVDLVESYGNQILSVSVDDERFDVEYADSLLTLTSREAVARGTYRMTLEAVCDDGRTYSYPHHGESHPDAAQTDRKAEPAVQPVLP